jgi:hypothetical protein
VDWGPECHCDDHSLKLAEVPENHNETSNLGDSGNLVATLPGAIASNDNFRLFKSRGPPSFHCWSLAPFSGVFRL